MTANHKIGRRTVLLSMTDDEFNARFAAIEDAFGSDWLKSGDHPLQTMWQSKDGLAVNQLLLLGDALAGLKQIDPRWVDHHIAMIKNGQANDRRGSMFELLGTNLFRAPGQIIRPTRRNAPGFDAQLTLADGAQADISLKSYGTSTHELAFKMHAGEIQQAFMDSLRTAHMNALVLGAVARRYPTRQDWDILRSSLPELLKRPRRQHNLQNVWTVVIKDAPVEFAPFSTAHLSSQVFLMGPYHQNESKNLFDKFEEACANARRHAKTDQGERVRIVLLKVPETISLAACHGWTQQYIDEHPDGPIDGVYLYQLTVADLPGGDNVMHHAHTFSEGANFAAWRSPAGRKRRGLSLHFSVGIFDGQPTERKLAGPKPVVLDECYVYQRGEFYTVFKSVPGRATNATLHNVASGIMRHAVVDSGDGKHEVLGGFFPPTKEISLFD